MTYRITLAYDGTQYCGWQMQLGQLTVQGVLSETLHRLEGVPVTVFGAGRTDAGVHAEGQVVSFRLSRDWEGMALRKALNGNLPPDIRVLEAAPAAAQFHARFDAKGKTYRYRLYTSAVMSPFEERYAWHYPYELDAARILEELEAEHRWDEAFAQSTDLLDQLADEALAEHRAGKTLPLDPDTL